MLKDAVCAKYPGFIEQIEAEDQEKQAVENYGRAIWRYEQQSRNLPNLLRDFLHCEQFGRVIDEVLHHSVFHQPAESHRSAVDHRDDTNSRDVAVCFESERD
jgi:hypothetical protein